MRTVRCHLFPIADLVILRARHIDVRCRHGANALTRLLFGCQHIQWHILVRLWLLNLILQLCDLL